MNLQFYLEKLHSSEEFRKFKKENPKAFFCSGFFILDREKNANEVHLDFFTQEKNELAVFKIDGKITRMPAQSLSKKMPGEISEEMNFDFNEIENLILEKMQKENLKDKVQKIILSLQNSNRKTFLLGTVFVSMLGMIKVKIKLPENKITEFEKKSILDMMNVFRKK
ncbi:MAG: hypothetical protein ABIH49_02000 [archaeon]